MTNPGPHSEPVTTWLLGIAEGVAAYGDHLDNIHGDQLAAAAREAVNRFWDDTGEYPARSRSYRDYVFGLLMNTQPSATRRAAAELTLQRP
jgi:hypothetical protein